MDSFNNAVIAYWPIAASFMVGVVWLVRLEAKVLVLESEKTSMSVKLDALQVTLTAISVSLARLEGKIEGSMEHQE